MKKSKNNILLIVVVIIIFTSIGTAYLISPQTLIKSSKLDIFVSQTLFQQSYDQVKDTSYEKIYVSGAVTIISERNYQEVPKDFIGKSILIKMDVYSEPYEKLLTTDTKTFIIDSTKPVYEFLFNTQIDTFEGESNYQQICPCKAIITATSNNKEDTLILEMIPNTLQPV